MEVDLTNTSEDSDDDRHGAWQTPPSPLPITLSGAERRPEQHSLGARRQAEHEDRATHETASIESSTARRKLGRADALGARDGHDTEEVQSQRKRQRTAAGSSAAVVDLADTSDDDDDVDEAHVATPPEAVPSWLR
eukprot:COSAG05_NODE_8254_length_722_cov_1.105939_1_plen_135_part_10